MQAQHQFWTLQRLLAGIHAVFALADWSFRNRRFEGDSKNPITEFATFFAMIYAGRAHSHSAVIPSNGDHVIQIYRVSIVFCFCAMLCHAQTAKIDQDFLTQIREKYDAPFNRTLQSFDCAVDFSWKDHFTETTRVGDEGTDEELEKIFQPIRNRVAVTRQNVTVSSGFTDDAISKLPHGGMAEFLPEHAVQKGLSSWLRSSTNSMLPPPDTTASLKQSKSGYELEVKLGPIEIGMVLTPDMRLQSSSLKGPESNHFETSFEPGPQGFLLTSLTTSEDGNWGRGHHLIYTYTYQTVDGVQLPEHVAVMRESHHEVWRYRLSDCSVKTSK